MKWIKRISQIEVRPTISGLLIFLVAGCAGFSPARFPDLEEYQWNQVNYNVRNPVRIANAGDGSDRLFIVGKQGEIWIISNGQISSALFLDITDRVNSNGPERGLLGLAFHPNFDENGYFYVNYTDNNGGNTVISQFNVSENPNRANHSSELVLLKIEQPHQLHNGGNLVFGPDGLLYIGIGDGGLGADDELKAQSDDDYLGKLLRIDVDDEKPYTVPDDNPIILEYGRTEIWAKGLRNPWSFAFDAFTGELYIADVGHNTWEEINYLPPGYSTLANFGWNYFEGHQPFRGAPPEGQSFITPIFEYKHTLGRCAVIGGDVYRGKNLPEWQGVYFYGDLCTGEIFGLIRLGDGKWSSRLLYDLGTQITAFGTDENGEIYVGGPDGLFILSKK